jgi:hypothetical protein
MRNILWSEAGEYMYQFLPHLHQVEGPSSGIVSCTSGQPARSGLSTLPQTKKPWEVPELPTKLQVTSGVYGGNKEQGSVFYKKHSTNVC